ncbi:MAG: hypothetical protein V1846_03025 [Candidatus Komeilibacteria bacterium]
MIFVEFTPKETSPMRRKYFFVGASLEDVLADTSGGTEFGFVTFASHREISEEEARSLKLGYLDKGIQAVKNGCKSYMLD